MGKIATLKRAEARRAQRSAAQQIRRKTHSNKVTFGYDTKPRVCSCDPKPLPGPEMCCKCGKPVG